MPLIKSPHDLPQDFPAGGNLVERILSYLLSWFAPNRLDADNLKDLSVGTEALADECIEPSHVTPATLEAQHVANLTAANFAGQSVGGGWRMALNFDTVDGADAKHIGCLGVVKRNIVMPKSQQVPIVRSSEVYSFFWSNINETFTPADFGLKVFPDRYSVVISTSRLLGWTHHFGLNNGRLIPEPTNTTARHVGQWFVEKTVGLLRLRVLGLVVSTDIGQNGGAFTAPGGPDVPPGAPAGESDLNYYRPDFDLTVAIIGQGKRD